MSLRIRARCWYENDPNQAAFHLVRCEAFDQEAKNAWEAFKQESKKASKKVEDFPTIEAATRKALAAACTALQLDPRNTFARMKVAGLQDKMVGLASRQPPSQ